MCAPKYVRKIKPFTWYDATKVTPPPEMWGGAHPLLIIRKGQPEWEKGWYTTTADSQPLWIIPQRPGDTAEVAYWMDITTDDVTLINDGLHRHVKHEDPRWSPHTYTCICGFETPENAVWSIHLKNKK
jgi:hypothetical protein